MLTNRDTANPASTAETPADGRPIRLATDNLADAVQADRQRRRELVLLALEASRASSRRPRPVSRFA